MYHDEFGRRWQGPYPFNWASIMAEDTDRFGVYQVLFADGSGYKVAYIGIATGDTIRGRLSKHVRGKSNWALARVKDSARFSFVFYPCDAKSARQIESHVVCTQKPPFNVKQEYKDFIPSITVH